MYLLILPDWSGKKLRLQCVDLWEVCEVHWLYASIDSVPQVIESACHHSNTQTNKPTKRDGRVAPLIFLLHNADKASADPPIG